MSYQLFMDGFDYYATADITKKWQSNYAPFGSASFQITESAGRRSTGALSVQTGPYYAELTSKSFTQSRYITIGFAIKVPILASAYGVSIYIYFGSVKQCRFALTGTTAQWEFYREGAARAALSANSMQYDAWNYVEIGVDLDNAGSYELRVNGSSAGWLPQTSYDTLVTTGGGATAFSLYRTNTANVGRVYFDDLYACYGDELKWLGDSRIDALNLTGNSTPQDWTPDTGNAWERLNQDAGYISSSTVNAVSLFNASDISHNPTTIHGIQLNGHAYKSDAGYREAALALKSGATTSVGTPLALSTDALLIREPYIVDPNTSVAFTKSGVNALEVGAKVTG